MGFLTKIKDKTTSFIGSIVLKKKLERYGKMLDFKIDSQKKQIYVSVSLKGEAQPLEVLVNKYSFAKEGPDDYIVIENVSISKEWMNLLAADFLTMKKFKLPAGIATTAAHMIL